MSTVTCLKSLSRIAMILLILVGAGYAAAPSPGSAPTAKATFAGGCFWCMEPPYDELDGVMSTISGYIGGTKKNPTYEEVVSGNTGHAEAVQIAYDPKKISYEKLLEVFWRNIDPLTANAQFCDSGNQYRSAIFYHDDAQKKLAEASKKVFRVVSNNPSSRKSFALRNSIRPKTITRTITKRTPFATKSTAMAAAATNACKSCGALKRNEKGCSSPCPLNS